MPVVFSSLYLLENENFIHLFEFDGILCKLFEKIFLFQFLRILKSLRNNKSPLEQFQDKRRQRKRNNNVVFYNIGIINIYSRHI